MNEQQLEIDLSTEEENNGSKNESKEADGKDKYNSFHSMKFFDHSLNIMMFREFMFINHEEIYEVSTPPPER